MTVRDWLRDRAGDAPMPLTEHLFSVLGGEGDAPESQTGAVCLRLATRLLADLISDERFGRDSALELLTIDALMTYAFEHASASGLGVAAMESLAQNGASMVGRLGAAHG